VLSISITSNKDQNFLQPATIAEKATIGRNPGCDIHLPDPDKHISRLHALVEFKDGDYHLSIASKTNSVSVNEKSYPHGSDVILAEGDRIGIYNYILTINTLTKSASNQSQNSVSAAEMFITSSSPWADATVPSIGGNESDPFGLADLMTRPATIPAGTGPDPFAMLTPTKHGLVDDIAPIAPVNKSTLLDPMAALKKRDAYDPLNISANAPSPFDDLLKSPSTPSKIDGFGSILSGSPLVDLGGHHPTGTRSLEHVHDINLPFNPPPIQEQSAPAAAPSTKVFDDPFADTLRTYIGKLAPATASTPAPATAPATAYKPDDAPAHVTEQPLWPSQTAAHPLSSATHTTYAPPAHNPNEQLLLDAFRNAAGLANQTMTTEESVAYMESIGTILRASIEGIVSLLASRSMLKGELGAEDRTMVAVRDNNPLKLMPDIKEVMQFLFENKKLNSSTYLSPVQSIQGACEDLIFHELGTAAGMRAAVEGSIRRFNPQLIEAAFDKSGKKMTLNRKGALWDTYVKNYRKIELSMADDVGQLFERDFRRAYDVQIRKLKLK